MTLPAFAAERLQHGARSALAAIDRFLLQLTSLLPLRCADTSSHRAGGATVVVEL